MAQWEVKVSTLYRTKEGVETWRNAKEVGNDKDTEGLAETISSLRDLVTLCIKAGDKQSPAVPVLVLAAVKVKRSLPIRLLGLLGPPSESGTPATKTPSETSRKSSAT